LCGATERGTLQTSCATRKPTRGGTIATGGAAARLIKYLHVAGPDPVIPVVCQAPGNIGATATEARARPGQQPALVQSKQLLGE